MHALRSIAICVLCVMALRALTPQVSNNQASYNLINLSQAYAKNPSITGANIIVGVVDSVFNTTHPSLINKSIGTSNNAFDFLAQTSDAPLARHGTHVTGIIIGKQLEDSLPHGIAHEGRFYGIGLLNGSRSYEGSIYEDIKKTPVSIMNNSWEKKGFYPLINRFYRNGSYASISAQGLAPISADEFFRLLVRNANNQSMKEITDLIALSREGILQVVASGNDGALVGGILASAPSYDESLRAYLVVNALDASNITKSSNALTIKTGVNRSNSADNYYSGVAEFSNLFKGNALYALSAPGAKIYSADALYQNPHITQKDRFIEMSGTSMAAPMVSGAAMLVAQKYPFLSGGQIADVLLSTANDNVSFNNANNARSATMLVQHSSQNTYNIIYIEQDPPMNEGKINKTQVQNDLQSLGFSASKAQEILNNLYRVPNTTSDDPLAEAIVRLEKHEIIGQGVLDVEKALQGLGRLDANRLDASAKESLLNTEHIFYTLDTKGYDAEFSNAISQREWDDKWHISSARNVAQSALIGISNIGLKKIGKGRLTLSGENTYLGASYVQEGVLALSTSGSVVGDIAASDKGAFIILGKASKDAYVFNGGVLELEGGSITGTLYAQHEGIAKLKEGSVGSIIASQGLAKVHQSNVASNVLAQAKGMVQILGTLRAGGAVRASDHGIIQLAGNDARLIASNINIEKDGVLEGIGSIAGATSFTTRTASTQTTQTTQTTQNTAQTALLNTGGIIRAGFGASDVGVLKILGTYRQEAGELQIMFKDTKASNSPTNSIIEADNVEIIGGGLVFVPMYGGMGSRIKGRSAISLDLGGFSKEVKKFHQVSVQDTNTLAFSYDVNNHVVNASFKANAFNVGNASLSKALQDIAATELTSQYDEYFGALDMAESATYTKSLESMNDDIFLADVADTLHTQQYQSLQYFSFLFQPPYKRDVFSLASIRKRAHLAMLSNKFSLMDDKDALTTSAIDIGAHYRITAMPGYSANASSITLQHRQKLSSRALFGGFIEYGGQQMLGAFASARGQSISLGGGGQYELAGATLLGLASLGIGGREIEREFFDAYGASSKRTAHYVSYQLALHAGVAKDMRYQGFLVKPLALLHYGGVGYGGFDEKGGIFRKHISDAYYSGASIAVGSHMGYLTSWRRFGLEVGGYGLYNVRLRNVLDAQVAFTDFTWANFSQTRDMERQSMLGGLSARLWYKGVSSMMQVGYEGGFNGYSSIGGRVELGVRF